MLPELGLVTNKPAAALVGVAPYDDSSGKHQGRRFIQGGRRKLRNLLYLPIVGAATRCNPVLKAYYKRLIARGKPPKVALIACMRKLIVILNTMLARGEKWDPQKHAIAYSSRSAQRADALEAIRGRGAAGVKARSRRRRGRAGASLEAGRAPAHSP